MTEEMRVIRYVRRLFSRPMLESYDSITKTSSGVGGAQLFQLPGWKTNKSPIVFNNEKFGNVLKSLGVSLFAINRALLDKDGNPVLIPGTNRKQRVDSGLLLYTQFGDNGQEAREFTKIILNACPQLEGLVAPVVDLMDTIPDLADKLSTYQVRASSFDGEEPEMMNPKRAIICFVPSGSTGSSQYWSYVKKTQTRDSLNEITSTGNNDISLI